MTERTARALQNFASGCNCAQSVLAAYADVVKLTEEQAMRLAAGFGGGMGRLRRDCGAFSAAVMLVTAMEGENSETPEARVRLYTRVQRLYGDFVSALGTVNCAKLLGKPEGSEPPTPDPRTTDYYASRPCARIIRTACEIIEMHLAEGKSVRP